MAKRSLSGIKPTGAPHLGNYLGMIRPAIELQDSYDAFYFVADYHALTSTHDRAAMRAATYDATAIFLAFGLDPERSVFWRQSDTPGVTELTWVLSCMTSMGHLERAHAYKAARDRGEAGAINHGVFSYPVLMAADILMYDSDVVPVGKDQVQHIEMARDMAQRFNRIYETDVLVLPEPLILEETATVPGTDGRKMSKSYGNTISMFAAKGKVKKAVMGIVTDSTSVEDPKDVNQAVFQLWSLFAAESERETMFERARAGGLGYGDVKKDLLARLMDFFEPMRNRRAELEEKPEEVEAILRAGAVRARELAMPTLEACREAAGLGGARR